GRMGGRKWMPKKPQAKEASKLPQEEQPAPAVEAVAADAEMPLAVGSEVPQVPEGVDIGMDVGKLCTALASVYSSLIEVETGKQERVSRFHSKVAPGIGVEQYLTRLAKYFQCHESCLLLALVYIDRA
ncbi:preg, partial [Symbiodinium sp. KB8]